MAANYEPAGRSALPRAFRDPVYGPTVPRWVRVVLLVNLVGAILLAAVYFSTATGVDSEAWERRVTAPLLALPFLFVALKMRDEPPMLLYGVTAQTTLWALPGLALMLLGVGWTEEGFASWGVRLVLFVMAANLVVFLWIVHRSLLEEQLGATRQALTGFYLTGACAALALAIAARIGLRMEDLSSRQVETDERDLRHGVVATAACAFKFAATHPGAGYPPSIDAMGPRGSGCLTSRFLKQQKEYGLLYVATDQDTAGNATAFVVRGHAPGRGAMVSMLADTTGEVRLDRYIGQDTVAAVEGDQLPVMIARLRDCVEALHVESGHWPSLNELTFEYVERINNPHASEPYRRLGCDPVWPRFELRDTVSSRAHWLGYRLKYAPDASGYRLSARPERYGVTALRSYLFVGDQLYVTRDDREATDDDATVPDCKPYDWGDCLPTAWTEPPRAILVHDAAIADDQPYTIAVRVLGNPGHVPQDIQWRFDCDVRSPADTMPPRLNDFRPRRGDDVCARLSTSRPAPIGDSVTVRVWLKSPNDDISRIQHVVPVIHATTLGRR